MMMSIILILTALLSITDGSSLNPLSIGVRSAIARSSLFGLNHNHCTHKSSITRQCSNLKQYPIQPQCDTLTPAVLPRGGASKSTSAAAATALPTKDRRLHFWEAMICGAISRSAAQTIMHPANVMKTILQSSRRTPGKAPLTVSSFTQWKHAKQLTRGAGAQLVLSIPHGAVNFAVLEFVRRQINNVVTASPYADVINRNFGPGMDFISSAISTVCCSVVSTPQMMICDNIMAGTYGNLVEAVKGLFREKGGVNGFYSGWWPGIAGKIPSYGLTWTLFEQIKRVRTTMSTRPATDIENSIMGCMASATTVCIMIPMDTVKTRLVTQLNYPDLVPYNGISDCFKRVLKEEGIGAFYRGLTPRLLSVVPMIGIQFGFYEFTKKLMLAKDTKTSISPSTKKRITKSQLQQINEEAEKERSRRERIIEEMAMEVAADDDQPFPAPYRKRDWWGMAVRQLQKEKQPCGVSNVAG